MTYKSPTSERGECHDEMHRSDLQYVRYDPGGQFLKHFDRNNDEMFATGMVYISDVDDGGETWFPKLGLRAKPREGDLLLWYHCDSGSGKVNPFSVHEGSPVKAGRKFIMNRFMHGDDRCCATEPQFPARINHIL